MFCNFCGRQNKDDVLFCEFCGKSMPQKNSQMPETQREPTENQRSVKAPSSKPRISFTAIKAIITGLVIVGLVLVVLLIYYPSVFPWNW
jgi:uncharacterized membrane protein YvbJ